MVAIKHTEMPKSCLECRLTYPRWDFNIGCKCCNAIIGHHEEYGEYETKRHPDCPLVEIITCKDCCQVNCSYHEQMCDPEEYRPNFYCADAVRRG